MTFDTLKDGFSLPEAEERILKFWESEQVFDKLKKQSKDCPHFVFYEGPPTANGRPGIHHVISRTVKDLFCRFKSMQGFRVDRKAGWDTHGLPVEIETEKKLGLDTKAKIVKYGIDKFNQKCRESVFTYLKDWDEITRRTGYWIDLDDAYVTLTNDYIESVWWILKTFYDRGLIYKGFKTLPYCPRCETGLSSHEVAQGYELVKDPSIYVKFKAADGDFSYLAWTTTPWTLPSNAALCMKPDADYVMIEHEGEKLVLAEALLPKLFDDELPVLQRNKGNEFVNREYEPLFDTFKDADDAFVVINADFVTLDDGTGIVHVAPGFGSDDYEAGKQYGLPVLQAIYPNGHFKESAGSYAGMFIKDADPVIVKDLKIAGKLFKRELYEHNYPFCWRCSSPLIYISMDSWYIRTTQFKEQLLDNSNAVNWCPDEIGTGRMADWLQNNVDWAISRQRFWGTPLPIWVCDSETCDKKRAVGSIEQLRKEGIDVPDELDLHKPMMDRVQLRCECGSTMTRVPEVIDVWFDSGAMPFAQWHYPFENKEEFEKKHPADFISEAIDQTRGWFYSLLAISTMLFDKAPYKNVVVLEFILDKEGKKMSKSKGNVVDPFTTVDKFGADPLRWYMVSTSNPWLPTRFDLDGLAEVVRKYFDTLRNTYSFFALYANIDRVTDRANTASLSIDAYLESKAGPSDRFDRWIESKYNSLVRDVTAGFEKYDITKPVRAIQSFVIDELSNWYVRNNRRRFWAKGDDPSKMRAYLTLYRIIIGLCRLTAPVAPFVSEMIYRELTGDNQSRNTLPLSVHLTEFPRADESVIDNDLEQAMTLAEQVVSLGRAARSRHRLKVRQPLSRLMVALPDGIRFESLSELLSVIREELNVKKVAASGKLNQYLSFAVKLNFKTAGPKLGGNVKAVAAALAQMDSSAIQVCQSSGKWEIAADGKSFELSGEDVDVSRIENDGYAVESTGAVTIVLVTSLTNELVDEGFAREIVNKIQNMRKTSGFDVTDTITVRVATSKRLQSAATRYDEFIRRETLATSIEFIDISSLPEATEWNINGEKTAIALSRVTPRVEA